MFWVSSDFNLGKKVRVFHFFVGGVVFWVRLDLDSGNNFNFQGGCSGTKFQNRGGGVL